MHWRGGELRFPLEGHNVGSQTCTQGPMGVGYPGLEQCGKGPAEAGRGKVEGRRRGNEPNGSHPPFVRKEYHKLWQARFRCEDRHWSGTETVGDPPLHLPPMDLHLVEKAFGGGKQVGTIGEDREPQAVGKSVTQVEGDALARLGGASNREEGGLR